MDEIHKSSDSECYTKHRQKPLDSTTMCFVYLDLYLEYSVYSSYI
jgi:hypothetical protein